MDHGFKRACAVRAAVLAAKAAAATIQVGPTRTFTEIATRPSRFLERGRRRRGGRRRRKLPVLVGRVRAWRGNRIRIVGAARGRRAPADSRAASARRVHADHVVVEASDLSGGSSNCFLHHGRTTSRARLVVHDCPGQASRRRRDSGSFTARARRGATTAAAATQTIRSTWRPTRSTHPGACVPDAALLRPRRQRRQQRQVARRAQRDLLQLDRGRALSRARAHRPRGIGAGGRSTWCARTRTSSATCCARRRASFVTRIGGDGTGQTERALSVREQHVHRDAAADRGVPPVRRARQPRDAQQRDRGERHRRSNVLRAASGDFTWVNGTNLAGSNNWIRSGREPPCRRSGRGRSGYVARPRQPHRGRLARSRAARSRRRRREPRGPDRLRVPEPAVAARVSPAAADARPPWARAEGGPSAARLTSARSNCSGGGRRRTDRGAGGASGTDRWRRAAGDRGGGTGAASGETGGDRPRGTTAGGASGRPRHGPGAGGESGATGAGGTSASGAAGGGGTGTGGASGATGGSGAGAGGASGATAGGGTTAGGAGGATGGAGAGGGGGATGGTSAGGASGATGGTSTGAGGASGATGGGGASGAGGFAGAAGVSGASG